MLGMAGYLEFTMDSDDDFEETAGLRGGRPADHRREAGGRGRGRGGLVGRGGGQAGRGLRGSGGQADRGGGGQIETPRARPADRQASIEGGVVDLRQVPARGGGQHVGRVGRGGGQVGSQAYTPTHPFEAPARGGGDHVGRGGGQVGRAAVVGDQARLADRPHEADGSRGGRGAGGRDERAQRARAWVFTINNYRDVPKELPKGTPKVRYLCFGREVSSTGTPHLQGYVVFENAVAKPSEVFKKFGNGWFGVAKGSAEDNIEYTGKDGDFTEFGQRPQNKRDQGHHGSKGGSKGGQMERDRWSDAWDSAKRGALEEIPGDIKLRYYSTITKVAAKYAKPPPELEKLSNTWIVGPSGSGKSTFIHREYPGAYKKDFSK